VKLFASNALTQDKPSTKITSSLARGQNAKVHLPDLMSILLSLSFTKRTTKSVELSDLVQMISSPMLMQQIAHLPLATCFDLIAPIHTLEARLELTQKPSS
jgi:hypothetical protein